MPPRKKPDVYIHVHQNHIRSNLKDGQNRPVITVKEGKSNRYGHEAHIKCKCGETVGSVLYAGPGRVKPLIPCGARVAIVLPPGTEVEVIHDEEGIINDNT